jgi:hypothetical protein
MRRKKPEFPLGELTTDDELFAEGLVANSPSALVGEVTEELWVKSQGWTPLEFLTHTYRNPWQEMQHRISAAKAVLDYVHRKLPSRLEVEGSLTETKKLDANSLSKLSNEELAVFTKLLEKLGGLE